jgi:aryl-phospho-beta-D-glucosidase BglC (GH1 family)
MLVLFVFFRDDDSSLPSPTSTTVVARPTLVLSGATVIAASPAAGENIITQAPVSGETPIPNSDAQLSSGALPPFPPDSFGYGIQVQGSVGDPAVTISAVKKLGMNWIKQQVRWEHIEPESGQFQWWLIDGIINEAHNAGIYVMLSVVTAPEWTRGNSGGGTHGPPDNYNEFGRFLGDIIDRYKGKVQAIEVWNEQNLVREWQSPNGVSATDYVQLLQVARQVIKQKDPNIIVISGALSPTGVDDGVNVIDDFRFFDMLLDAGMLDHVDCVGAHHNGINMPPDKDWDEGYNDPTAEFRGPFDNAHHSWSFKSTLQGYYEKILQRGRQTKLCVTEFGWATSEGFDGTPQDFEFANDNTLQEQADWIVQAFQLQRQWGTTWIAYLWNLNYANTSQDPLDPNVPYSIVDFNGVPRPAFDALERMEKP